MLFSLYLRDEIQLRMTLSYVSFEINGSSLLGSNSLDNSSKASIDFRNALNKVEYIC